MFGISHAGCYRSDMCERYRIRGEIGEVLEHLPNLTLQSPYEVRFNVAPGQLAPVVRRTEGDAFEITKLRWGVPSRTVTDPDATGPSSSFEHHEAATRIAHRVAYLHRRCLIPCNGIFVWQQVSPQRRVPWLLTYPGESLMMLAGIWEVATETQGVEFGESFAILTTRAPNRVNWVRDKFPVVVPADVWQVWLDPRSCIASLADIAHRTGEGRPNRDLQQWRVTSLMSAPDYEDPSAVAPMPPRVDL